MSEFDNPEQKPGSPDAEPARPQKPGDMLVGKMLFNRFEVLEVLGESNMALVLKARDTTNSRLVAIKTVTPNDPDTVKRFAQEVQLHGSLKHKNIVEAIDCLEASGGRTFFIMEFLAGASLHNVLRTQERIKGEDDLSSILIQICDALSCAHEAGILHRDLKPGNIFLQEENGRLNVKVLDFGIAKPLGQQTGLTQAGYAVGSPLYMSPEQCRGQQVDARADVYSLGILAYEMTTGSLPYAGHNIMTVMAAHCDPDRRPTGLDQRVPTLKRVDELNAIIQTAMETDPAKRFQTVGEFRKAVQHWQENVRSEQLSSLLVGETLDVQSQTMRHVAEEALKSSGSAIQAIPSSSLAPDDDNAPYTVPTPPQPTAAPPPPPAPPPTQRLIEQRQPHDHSQDEKQIESVPLSMTDQKHKLRTRLQLSTESPHSNKTKIIIFTAALVLLVLLIALFAMGRFLLN